MIERGSNFDIAQLKLILYILEMREGLCPEFRSLVGEGVMKDVIQWLKETIDGLEREKIKRGERTRRVRKPRK